MRALARRSARLAARLTLAVTLAVSTTGAPFAQQNDRPRPDVLVVVAGDLGWKDIAPRVRTPKLQRLMKRGFVYRNAFAFPAGPLTSYSLTFGRYPRRDGIFDSPSYYETEASRVPNPDPALVSLPKVMKSAGYATGLFGKWNLGRLDEGERARTPLAHGYDVWRAGVPGILARGGGTGYTDWLRVDDGVEAMSTEYQTLALARAFEDWWSATEGPRFAVCAFAAAHGPFHDPPSELVPTPPRAMGKSPRARMRRDYEAMVQSLDTVLGRMLATVGDETLVVFLADNGTPIQVASADQDAERVKHSTFDGGIHVPLVLAGPGIEPGESAALVSTVDLPATLAALVDARVPDGAFVDSLAFAAKGALAEPTRDFVYVDANDEEFAVRTSTHKLRLLREGEGFVEELYELRTRRGEGVPLDLSDPAARATADALRALLDGVLGPPGPRSPEAPDEN